MLLLEAVILHGIRSVEPEYQPNQYSEKMRNDGQNWLWDNLAPEDRNRYVQLLDLRNSVSHGSQPRQQTVAEAVEDETKMRALLNDCLRFAERLLGERHD